MSPRKPTVALAPKLELPAAELATKVVAALGMRGSGKSNSMAVIVEGLLRAHIQVVILDYVGIWFGLRLAPDGKKPSGLNIPILGGRHGDIPLVQAGGALVAQSLTRTSSSAILDVSTFKKGERVRFATDFGEALFEAKQQDPGPCFLVLEEAQRFVPQVIRYKGTGLERCLGAYEEIAEVGRNFGIGLGLISQRPQKINKDVLNLTELLLGFQANGVLERKAIAEWVQETNAQGRESVHGDLPSLQTGKAIVWSPAWRRIYGKYEIYKKTTYDAGATPLANRARVHTKPLELPTLSAAMAELVEEARVSDPKALKTEIARLKAELERKNKVVYPAPQKILPAAKPQVVERVPLELKRWLAGMGKEVGHIMESYESAARRVKALASTVEAAHSLAVLRSTPTPVKPLPSINTKAISCDPPQKPFVPRDPTGELSPTAMAIIQAIAQKGGRANDTQISILAKRSVTSSGFDIAMGLLRKAGLMTGGPDARELTQIGWQRAGTVEPMPDGRELLDFWVRKLDRCEGKLLETLFAHGNGPLSREELSEQSGYSMSSSGFDMGISTLKKIQLAHGTDDGKLALDETFR